jgi:hypothetical protein
MRVPVSKQCITYHPIKFGSDQICKDFFSSQIFALGALEIVENGDFTAIGSFLARFFAFPASIHRYAREPCCQAITMATGSAKPRETENYLVFRKQG